MIKYTVKISDKAQADMEQIYSYIAKELMSPRNALGQYNCFFYVIENGCVIVTNVLYSASNILERIEKCEL